MSGITTDFSYDRRNRLEPTFEASNKTSPLKGRDASFIYYIFGYARNTSWRKRPGHVTGGTALDLWARPWGYGFLLTESRSSSDDRFREINSKGHTLRAICGSVLCARATTPGVLPQLDGLRYLRLQIQRLILWTVDLILSFFRPQVSLRLIGIGGSGRSRISHLSQAVLLSEKSSRSLKNAAFGH